MRVIAMGYGMEPLDRVTAGSEDGVIFIVNQLMNHAVDKSSNVGVGFPHHCVFEFSESLWHDLASAWEDGNTDRLKTLWAGATPVSAMASV